MDAIDNINTKIDLMKNCYDRKLNVISSMGAGAKADPSRIQIADISETFGKTLLLFKDTVSLTHYIQRIPWRELLEES